MQKKLWIIALSSLVFVLIIFIIILNIVKNGATQKPKPEPGLISPTQVRLQPTFSDTNLTIVSSSPKNYSTQVPLNSVVRVVFSRQIRPNELNFEFINDQFINVDYSLSLADNKATLTPKQPLEPSRAYTVRVRDSYLRIIGKLEFSALTLTPSPDTRPVAALTETIIRTRAERPDIYLANLMPYESFDFKMDIEIDDEGYLTFVATSDRFQGELLKSAVERWLISIELTSEQIKDLPLEYR